VCQKDVKILKHHELDLPNLQVAKALLSLKSRGHVKEVFNWQWHYYFLTDTGIEYLREYLNLPADVAPATLKAKAGEKLGFDAARSRDGPRGPPRDGPRGAAPFRSAFDAGDKPAA
jgi:small subunit ribosomal protein S10e